MLMYGLDMHCFRWHQTSVENIPKSHGMDSDSSMGATTESCLAHASDGPRRLKVWLVSVMVPMSFHCCLSNSVWTVYPTTAEQGVVDVVDTTYPICFRTFSDGEMENHQEKAGLLSTIGLAVYVVGSSVTSRRLTIPDSKYCRDEAAAVEGDFAHMPDGGPTVLGYRGTTMLRPRMNSNSAEGGSLSRSDSLEPTFLRTPED